MKSTVSEKLGLNEVKHLSSAFDLLEEIDFNKVSPILFLDFDGTLTPIVDDPNKADLSHTTAGILKRIQEKHPCSILTGRDRKDVEKRIGIDGITYAGSHGFDIKGPDFEMLYEKGKPFLKVLDKAESELKKALISDLGAQIERKKFAIAVHYRHVPEEEVDNVLRKVYEVLERNPKLKAGPGKMVLELKPDIEWNKGEALTWLLKKFNSGAHSFPIFIGDDVTDEDGFKMVQTRGAGILVGKRDGQTYANYCLKDPCEVADFLQAIADKTS